MSAFKITPSSGNVFLDLGFDEEEAEQLQARSLFIIAIRKLIKVREKDLSRLEGKVEAEPSTRNVRIVQKGLLRIAVPVEVGPVLEEATVDAVLRKIRARRLR